MQKDLVTNKIYNLKIKELCDKIKHSATSLPLSS